MRKVLLLLIPICLWLSCSNSSDDEGRSTIEEVDVTDNLSDQKTKEVELFIDSMLRTGCGYGSGSIYSAAPSERIGIQMTMIGSMKDIDSSNYHIQVKFQNRRAGEVSFANVLVDTALNVVLWFNTE